MSKLSSMHEDLKAQLVEKLRMAPSGLSNDQLESHFGAGKMAAIAEVVNSLLEAKRLNLFTQGTGLVYKLVAEDTAVKFEGLTQEQMLVYQICERAGSKGVWTRDIKNQSSIPQHTLNKTIKDLETRCLIKHVRSVTSKSRKLYMLYDTVPTKEITGGPWYTDQEFDHAFVEELCKAVVNFVAASSRRPIDALPDSAALLQQLTGSGIIAANTLSVEELEMILTMLVCDGRLEEVRNASLGSANSAGGNARAGLVKFKVAKRFNAPNHLTEMPCGVCMVVTQCKEGGVISPTTCTYMSDWLALNYQELDQRQDPLAW